MTNGKKRPNSDEQEIVPTKNMSICKQKIIIQLVPFTNSKHHASFATQTPHFLSTAMSFKRN